MPAPANRRPRSAPPPPAPPKPPFESIYRHGFARVAVATPRVEVAAPALNVTETIALSRRAAAQRAVFALFPELGLSAYSNEDLFQQDALLDASLEALGQLLEASLDLPVTLAVGVPLQLDGRLFNCGVVLRRGRLLGVVPKTYLPNYREFYEKRQFASGLQAVSTEIRLLGQSVPFGAGLLFAATNLPGFVLVARDLRGRLGAAAAEHFRGARRRHGDRQPVRQRHHRGQGRLPPAALRLAVRQVRGRLPLLGGRPGRVDDRSRLGRPCAGLRERRAARRVRCDSRRKAG